MERRQGDKIVIDGGYQHHALLHASSIQRAWHHLKLSTAMQLAGIQKGARILDVGCGSGILTRYLPAIPTNYLGIDANAAAINFATETYSKNGVVFKSLLVDELNQLPENGFDCVFFLEIIEHITVHQGIEALQRFQKLLSPGGKCIISTPNRKSLWPLIERTLDFFKLVPALSGEQHEHLYTINELNHSAAAAGLAVKEVVTINAIAPWMAILGKKISAFIHRVELKTPKIPGSLILMVLEKK